MAASEEGTARRDSTFHGLTRGRWQPLVRDSKFGQRQQLLQSRGSRRRTIEDEQPLRRRRLLRRLRLLDEQRQRPRRWEPLDGVRRPRTHSTDWELAIRKVQHRDLVDEQLEPIWEDIGDLEDNRRWEVLTVDEDFLNFVLGQIVRTFVDYEMNALCTML